MDFIVLQNTRLNIVMKMADIIAMSVRYAIWKRSKEKENSKKSLTSKKVLLDI